ncbi:phosphatidylglycerophosphatase A [bacterium]|nr:phosphatidylglycerophosphatase A [bacterium]MBU1752999.1 phosphatidylglycerophosphatase A [bacterium]
MMKRIIVKFFATGFFSGYSPVASGTAGSMVGVMIYLAVYHLWSSFPHFWLFYTIGVVIISVAGIRLCSEAEAIFKVKDAKPIVWDEVAGYLITMIGIQPNLWWVISGFILFRVLDVIKPGPLYSLQKLPGGLGIMIDDIGCGILGCVILHGVQYFLR